MSLHILDTILIILCRTIKCTRLRCQKEIQLKDYDQHVDENKCFENVVHKVIRVCAYKEPLDSNGSSNTNVKEYFGQLLPSQKRFWVHKCDGKNFYFSESYLSDKKIFSYAVMMVGMNKEDVEAYSVQMVLSSKDEKFQIKFSIPVLPIDGGFDLNYDKLLEEKKTFFVSTYQMQQLLDSEIIEEDGEKFELVFFKLKLDIKKNYVM